MKLASMTFPAAVLLLTGTASAQDAKRNLPKEDLDAIVAYLLSLKKK